MQLPGLEELEGSVAKAVERLAALKEENARLSQSVRALGKEIDGLADQIESIKSGQKVDSRTKKRLEARLRKIAERLGR
ncbi:MAG: cell division protein ZapB [Candidatus Eisenbacteria bacterium]|nr:cell division protein ZapB [Candidatus Eisenbacteria bacterium]